jgi:hypothetical protein
VRQSEKRGLQNGTNLPMKENMPENTQEIQDNLLFQLDLLHLFAANGASDDAPRLEAGRLEDMLAQLEQSH